MVWHVLEGDKVEDDRLLKIVILVILIVVGDKFTLPEAPAAFITDEEDNISLIFSQMMKLKNFDYWHMFRQRISS